MTIWPATMLLLIPTLKSETVESSLEHKISGFSEQLLAGSHLSGPKFKVISSMPFWDNQKMPLGYRVLVPHNYGKAVLKQDRSIVSRAKRTFGIPVLVGRLLEE
jgi:hypothetical protein